MRRRNGTDAGILVSAFLEISNLNSDLSFFLGTTSIFFGSHGEEILFKDDRRDILYVP